MTNHELVTVHIHTRGAEFIQNMKEQDRRHIYFDGVYEWAFPLRMLS